MSFRTVLSKRHFSVVPSIITPKSKPKIELLKNLRQVEGTIYQTELLMMNFQKSLAIQKAEKEKILDDLNLLEKMEKEKVMKA